MQGHAQVVRDCVLASAGEDAVSLAHSVHVDCDSTPYCLILMEGSIAMSIVASLGRCGPLLSSSQDRYIILIGCSSSSTGTAKGIQGRRL